MLPLRLVFDTNEIVSAALKPNGIQRAALTLALTKPARLYLTHSILLEYSGVLARPKFDLARGERNQLLQLLRNNGYLVQPKYRVDAALDPDDNMFLECAQAARADYLITGNTKHFPKFWKNTKVITAREFLDLASSHLQR